jgi:hypothetical protein
MNSVFRKYVLQGISFSAIEFVPARRPIKAFGEGPAGLDICSHNARANSRRLEKMCVGTHTRPPRVEPEGSLSLAGSPGEGFEA